MQSSNQGKDISQKERLLILELGKVNEDQQKKTIFTKDKNCFDLSDKAWRSLVLEISVFLSQRILGPKYFTKIKALIGNFFKKQLQYSKIGIKSSL